jgi:hypothetical protein
MDKIIAEQIDRIDQQFVGIFQVFNLSDRRRQIGILQHGTISSNRMLVLGWQYPDMRRTKKIHGVTAFTQSPDQMADIRIHASRAWMKIEGIHQDVQRKNPP